MSEQYSFPGLAPAEPTKPSKPTRPSKAAQRARNRLFFAILPDAATADRITDLTQRLRGEHGLKGEPVATNRLHITLQFLGDYPSLPTDIITTASEAASGLAQQPFNVEFDHVMSFPGTPGNRPLVLRGGEGLDALILFRRNLIFALRAVLQGRGLGKSFTPHVTLLYDNKLVAEQKVEMIGWTVPELVLIHTIVGEGRYTAIGRWALG